MRKHRPSHLLNRHLLNAHAPNKRTIRPNHARRHDRGKRAERFGYWAEWWCIMSLWARGYQLLARRWRSPAGEIDIIAARGAVIVCIEVKARRTAEEAAYALQPMQQERLWRAAEMFLKHYPRRAGRSVRFDVMLVAPWRWPIHLTDAWRP